MCMESSVRDCDRRPPVMVFVGSYPLELKFKIAIGRENLRIESCKRKVWDLGCKK